MRFSKGGEKWELGKWRLLDNIKRPNFKDQRSKIGLKGRFCCVGIGQSKLHSAE